MKTTEIYSKLVNEIKENYDAPMYENGEITDYCITLSDDVLISYGLNDEMIHVYFKGEELFSAEKCDYHNLKLIYNVLAHTLD